MVLDLFGMADSLEFVFPQESQSKRQKECWHTGNYKQSVRVLFNRLDGCQHTDATGQSKKRDVEIGKLFTGDVA